MTRDVVGAVPVRWLLLLAGTAAVLLAGGVGYYFGWTASNDAVRSGDFYAAAQSRYAAFILAQQDNVGTNEDSLRAYIAYLEARAPNRERPNAYAFDKALALTRLSEIARRHGGADAAAHLANDAGALCPAIGLRNCSANELLRTTRERDRRIWGDPGG